MVPYISLLIWIRLNLRGTSAHWFLKYQAEVTCVHLCMCLPIRLCVYIHMYVCMYVYAYSHNLYLDF